MIKLLARLFIKHHNDTADPDVRRAYGTLCGAVGIALNLFLSLGKFLAGVLSGSIAVTADAFNNLLDAASSLITLVGFRLAGQKADPDHPFGHGRMEYISGFLVSVLTLLTMIELAKSSFAKILSPRQVHITLPVLIFLLLSVAVKGYMSLYNARLGKKLNAPAMKATAVDSLSDMLATAVVLCSALIVRFFGVPVDGWCGLIVCLFIGYAGLDAAKGALGPLLGQAPDREFVQQVYDITLSQKEILGVHDLIVHSYGPDSTLISLHAEVPADGDLITLHEVIDHTEHLLRDKLHCHAVIHMDPVRVGDEETERFRALVLRCAKEIDSSLTIHDFRIVPCQGGRRLFFDLAAPYGFAMSDAKLRDALTQRLNREDASLIPEIEIDRE